MKLRQIVGAALLTVCPQFAAVQYYLTDNLAVIDTNKWAITGQVVAGAAGFLVPDSIGASMISRIPIPDGTSEAEVDMTLTLTKSGGVYTEFLQATPDAKTASSGSGSYLAFEMQNPTFDSSGNCLATFVVLQSAAGSTTALASFQHGCRNGMQMRMAAHNGTLLVWPDQPTPIELSATFGSGQPGIGAYGTPVGNTISQVQLGSISRIALPAINSQQITSSAFRNRINVQWPATPIAVTSSGLNGYWIYRDGNYLMRTTQNSFIDEGIKAGDKHTYTIYVVDQHFNMSAGASVTATAPVAIAKTATSTGATAPKK